MAIPNTALELATEDVVVPGDAIGNFGVDARGEEEGPDILDCQVNGGDAHDEADNSERLLAYIHLRIP